MRRLKVLFATAIMTATILTGVFSVATPSVFAAPTAPVVKTCAQRFLTFPVWYRGLTVSDTDCDLKSPNDLNTPGKNDGLSNYIWHIVLNVIEIILQAIGYIAAFMIIYGGFQYLTGGAEPARVEAARKTILNAIIGLAISVASVGVVNLIFSIIN